MRYFTKRIWKRRLAGLLSVIMFLSLLPATTLAGETGGTTGLTAAEQVQTLIDGLPGAEEITADNRADVQAQIDAIDEAMQELSADEAAELDTARYDAAAAALLALDDPTGDNGMETHADPAPEPGALEQVQDLIDALPDADAITADNRADVQAQIDAIDAVILDLTEDEAAELDTARYDAVLKALLALDAPSALEQVQALIDALPDADAITDENRADVEIQLTAIDEAKLGLSDEELDALDTARYEAAVEALLALDGMIGADEPMAIATDYNVGTGSVSISKDGEYTITGNTSSNTITVNGGNVTITLKGVSVTSSGGCAFDVKSGNVTLVLEDGTTSSFTSGGNNAGIHVAENASLTIRGNGTLNAASTSRGAGIGGNQGGVAGHITIESGTITAKSADGAGIGGGHTSENSSGGTFQSITITGGNVTAESSGNGAGIGNGCWGSTLGTITISGGMIHARTGATSSQKPSSGDRAYDIGYSHSHSQSGGAIRITGGVIFTENRGIKNSSYGDCIVVSKSGDITVYGSPTITEDFTIPSGKELKIPSGKTLTVAEGATLTVPEGTKLTVPEGTKLVVAVGATLTNNGTIQNSGTINELGTIDGSGTIDGNQTDKYGLSVTAPRFDSLAEGYGQPPAQPITIENTGKVETTISKVTVSGNDFTLMESSDHTVAVGESNTSWTVQPRSGLAVGKHTATITVTYNGGATAKADILFVVTYAADSTLDVSERSLLFDFDCRHTVRGTTTANTIKVTGGDVELTLDNVSITSSKCAFDIQGGNVTLILADGSVNTFISGGHFAGIHVAEGASLTIKGNGVLNATAKKPDDTTSGAGIGGNYDDNAGSITIKSGTVVAKSEGDGAGIGGGHANDGAGDIYGKFKSITIEGGKVTAESAGNGAGIGCGCWAKAMGTITISGGEVHARSASPAKSSYDIGYGHKSAEFDSNITISGGFVFTEGDHGRGIGAKNVSKNNCVIFPYSGKGGEFYGDPTIKSDVSISSGRTLTVPAGHKLTVETGATLTVFAGATLTNKGTIQNNGRIIQEGEIDGEINGNPSIKYRLSVTAPTFQAMREGYAQPDAEPVTIRNTENGTVTISRVELSGSDFILGNGSTGQLAQGETNTTWTVQPAPDLKYEHYEATIIVTFDGGLTAEDTVSFDVFGAPVPYLDSDGSEKSCEVYRPFKRALTALSEGWYVVDGSVTVSSRITVSGDVHLILKDGCTLTAQDGINVSEGNSLTIYGQSGQSGTLAATAKDKDAAGIGGGKSQTGGIITINGGNITASSPEEAGIGGGSSGNGGTITINGGTVTATGKYGSGIGSGSRGNGGIITINGGTINATSQSGAGIGGGGDGGILTINGGSITAVSEKDGAGIGGRSGNNGGIITINGGSVTATGGGRGYSTGECAGAGIGGGDCGGAGTITINGGIVTATGGSGAESYHEALLYGAPGIGDAFGDKAGTITITGGTITATGGTGCNGIGEGYYWYGYEGWTDRGYTPTFSTGANGNAVIHASISDKSQKSSWSGVFFDGNSGQVYGNPTPVEDFEVKNGETLTVPSGKTLTVADGVTLTNSGTITNNGHVYKEERGTIKGNAFTKTWEGAPYHLTVGDISFGSVCYGYAQPSPRSITISNDSTGNYNPNIKSVALSGDGFTLITGSLGTVTKGASNTSWSVQPESGLSAGEYKGTITVIYDIGGSQTKTVKANVSFTVTKADTDLTVEPVTYTYGTPGGITLAADVAPAVAGGISLMSLKRNQVVFSFPKEGKTLTVEDVSARGGKATVHIPAEQVKDYFYPGRNNVTVSYGGSVNLNPKESVSCTVTVNPKPLEFTFEPAEKTYDGDANITGELTMTTDLVGSDEVTASYTAAAENADAGEAVGVDVSVTLGGADKDYYTVTNPTGVTVNITPAELELTISDVSITYGDKLTDELLNGTAKIKGTEKTVTGTWAWEETSRNEMPAVSDRDKTTYKAVFTPDPEAPANFTEASRSKEVTVAVAKAAPTVTVNAVTGEYGGDITLTAHVTITGVDENVIDGRIEFRDGVVSLGTADVKNGMATLTVPGADRDGQHALFGVNGSSTVTAAYSGNDNISAGNGSGSVTVSRRTLEYAVTATDRTYEPGKTEVEVSLQPSNRIEGDEVTLTAAGNLSADGAAVYESVSLTEIKIDGRDKAYYTVESTADHVTLTAPVVIGRIKATVNTPPTGAADLIYTGSPLDLLTGEGTSNGGTMQYYAGKKDSTEQPDEAADWKEDISDITATDAGTYTVWYRANGNTDYATSDLASVTVTVAKTESAVTKAPVPDNRVYDGEDHPLAKAGTAEGGTMQYSLEQDGAYGDAIPDSQGAGKYTVWYKVAGDANHKDSEPQSVTVTIDKGEGRGSVTMRDYLCAQTGVTPEPQSDTNGTENVKYTYTVKGEDNYSDAKPATAGEYTVRAEFAETDNYNATTATADFTVTHRFNAGWEHRSDGDYSLCACGTGLLLERKEPDEVPESLKKNPDVDTVEKIGQVLTEKIDTGACYVIYDVELKAQTGSEWVAVTQESLPEEGVAVTIPYPGGTNARCTFTVAHMFTTAGDDHEPGDMEILETTNEADGIRFTLKSFSPVAIGWKAGGLTVAVTDAGEGADSAQQWHFRVELDEKTVSGEYGGMNFTDGVTEFTLRSGQSLTAQNLPAGVAYTVTELNGNRNGYTTTCTDDSGIITSEQDMTAAFRNDKPASVIPVIPASTPADDEPSDNTLSDNTLSDNTLFDNMLFDNTLPDSGSDIPESGVPNQPSGTPSGKTLSEETLPEEALSEEALSDSVPKDLIGDASGMPSDQPSATPSDDEPGNPPETADQNHLSPWLPWMILSLTGITMIVLLLILKRKRKKP